MKKNHFALKNTPLSISPNFSLKFGFLLTLLAFPACLSAQFYLNGTARQVSTRCYRLTDEQNRQVGSIWDTTKINLTQSFDANLDIYFGCKDPDGADGIVFGFQPLNASIGGEGEGMGFQGVKPSIGIEMDTWHNPNLNDPLFDHIAIFKNGDVTHGTANTLAGPVALDVSGNVEDCKFHNIRVTWDATAQKLEVFIDCVSKLSYTGDIVKDIFNGDPNVFWGFTAATGLFNNKQEVCFKFTTLLDKPSKVNLCKGDTVQLQAYGGETYRWTPQAGLSNPNIANPVVKPDTSTTYTVIVKDKCGNEQRQEIRLDVNGDPIRFELGKDTSICEGSSVKLDATGAFAKTFLWSTGETDSTILVRKSGVYTAELRRGNCIAVDSVKVKVILPPSVILPPDTLLCQGKRVLLDATTDDGQYLWQDNSTKPILSVLSTGLYKVTVTNRCGSGSAQTQVTYEECQKVFIPTAFSPNGDGLNDRLTVFGDEGIKKIRAFRIFDRWGEMVYQRLDFLPNDDNIGWNGVMPNGKNALAGTYVYWAEVEYTDGKIRPRKGEFLLVR
jgi:gliding motility-associated-like protein